MTYKSYEDPVTITFKKWTDPPPAGDTTLTCVLAQRCLQEEHRYSTGEQEYKVGDEECTCIEIHTQSSYFPSK